MFLFLSKRSRPRLKPCTNYSSPRGRTELAGRAKSLVVSLAALKPVFAKSQEIAELSKHFVMVNVEVS